MTQELTTVFGETMDRFYHKFSLFTKEQVNEVPFEGSWTPAQLVVHILKSQANLPQLLGGETEAAGRGPEEKKEILEKIFLDFNTKLNAPVFILPGKEPQDKAQLAAAIEERKLAIIHAIQSNDLNRLCLGFELPNLGKLTGVEWIWFVTFHVQRHTHQLERMYEAIKKTTKISQ